MRRSIRVKFFAWLGVQTALIFFAIGVVLFLYNLREQHEHPELRTQEAEEALMLAGIMALCIPLALGSAWVISKRLLHPWRQLASQAEQIGGGHLDERIEMEESEDEIGRLATVLNAAFDRYRQLLDRMKRFSFDASHQLRNPLAAIRTSGEVCLMQARSPAEYRSVIAGMLEDVQRLSRMVEHLLMLARATQDLPDELWEEVRLQEVAVEVVKDAQAVCEASGLTVALRSPDQPLAVWGIKELLREALVNLVDNALRFSPEGGRVDLEIMETAAGHVRIAVADAGPGLTADRKAMLFRPFVRGGGDREHIGLGLAIAADICRAHRGTIGVEDHEGGGSVFWMEWPLAR